MPYSYYTDTPIDPKSFLVPSTQLLTPKSPQRSKHPQAFVKLFKTFFIDTSLTSSASSTLRCPPAVTAIYYHFSPVTHDLRDIIKHMKTSTSPNDAIPSQDTSATCRSPVRPVSAHFPIMTGVLYIIPYIATAPYLNYHSLII